MDGKLTTKGESSLITIEGNMGGHLVSNSENVSIINVNKEMRGEITNNAKHSEANIGNLSGSMNIEARDFNQIHIRNNLDGNVNVKSKESDINVGGNLSGNLQSKSTTTALNADKNISGNIAIEGKTSVVNTKANLQGSVSVLSEQNVLNVGGNVNGSVFAKAEKTNAINVIGKLDGTVIEESEHLKLFAGGVSGKVSSESKKSSAIIVEKEMAGEIVTTGETSIIKANNLSGSVESSSKDFIVKIDNNMSGDIKAKNNNFNLDIGKNMSGEVSSLSENGTRISVGNTMTGSLNSTAKESSICVENDLTGSLNFKSNATDLKIKGDLKGSVKGESTNFSNIEMGRMSGNLTSNSKQNEINIQNDMSGKLTTKGINNVINVDGNSTGFTNIESENITIMNISKDLIGNVQDESKYSKMEVHSLTGKINSKSSQSNIIVKKDLEGRIFTKGDTNVTSVGGDLKGKFVSKSTNTSLSVSNDLSGLVGIVEGKQAFLNVGGNTGGDFMGTASDLTVVNVEGSMKGTMIVKSDKSQVDIGENLDGSLISEAKTTSLNIEKDTNGIISLEGESNIVSVKGNFKGDVLLKSEQITKLTVEKDVSGRIFDESKYSNYNIGNVSGQILNQSKAIETNIENDMSGTIFISSEQNVLNVGGNVKGYLESDSLLNFVHVEKDVSGKLKLSGNESETTVGGDVSGVVLSKSNTLNKLVSNSISGDAQLSGQVSQTIVNTVSGKLIADASSKNYTTISENLSGTLITKGEQSNTNVCKDVTGSMYLASNLNSAKVGNNIEGKVITWGEASQIEAENVHGYVSAPTTNTFINVHQDIEGSLKARGENTSIVVGGNVNGEIYSKAEKENKINVIGNLNGKIIEKSENLQLNIGSISGNGLVQSESSNLNAVIVEKEMAGKVFLKGDTSILKANSVSGSVVSSSKDFIVKVETDMSGEVASLNTNLNFDVGGNMSGSLQSTTETGTRIKVGQTMSGSITNKSKNSDITTGDMSGRLLSVSDYNFITTKDLSGDLLLGGKSSSIIKANNISGDVHSFNEQSTQVNANSLSGNLHSESEINTINIVNNVEGEISTKGKNTFVDVGGDVEGMVFVKGENSVIKSTGNLHGRVMVKVSNISNLEFENVQEGSSLYSESKTGYLTTKNYSSSSAAFLTDNEFTLKAESVNNTGTLTGTQLLIQAEKDINNSGGMSAKNLQLEGRTLNNFSKMTADNINIETTSVKNSGEMTSGNQIFINSKSVSMTNNSITKAKDIMVNDATSVNVQKGAFVQSENNLSVKSGTFQNEGCLKGEITYLESKTIFNDGLIKGNEATIITDSLYLGKISDIKSEKLGIKTEFMHDTSSSTINANSIGIQKTGSSNLKSQITANDLSLVTDDYNLNEMDNLKIKKDFHINMKNADKVVDKEIKLDNIGHLSMEVNSFKNNSTISGSTSVYSTNDIVNTGKIVGEKVVLDSKDGNIDLFKGQIHGKELEQVVAGKKIILQKDKSSYGKGSTDKDGKYIPSRKDIIFKSGEGDIDFSRTIIDASGEIELVATQGKVMANGSQVRGGNILFSGTKGVEFNPVAGNLFPNFKFQEYAPTNPQKGTINFISTEGKVSALNSKITSNHGTNIYGHLGVDVSTADIKSRHGDVNISSKLGDIVGRNVTINSAKDTTIISENGNVDISFEKKYYGRRPEFHVSKINANKLIVEGNNIDMRAADIETKEGGKIHATANITADSQIETYVKRSWSRSGFLWFSGESGYEEDAVQAITRIKTNGKFQILSDTGNISAKGIQIADDKQKASNVDMIAEKDINLNAVTARVHHSGSSYSWFGLNSSSRSGYNTAGNFAVVQASDNINIRSKSGKIEGQGVILDAKNISVRAKKGIDLKPYEIETYEHIRERGFTVGLGNAPSLINNSKQVFSSVSSMGKGDPGATGFISDAVGAGLGLYNMGVGLAQLSLCNFDMLVDEALKCISPSIGFYDNEQTFYQKQQVLGSITCNNLEVTVDDDDGKASIASNIQVSNRTVINATNVEFNNAQHDTRTTSRSTTFGVQLNIGSLLTGGTGVPITVSGSHNESKGSTKNNQAANINLGDTHSVRNSTKIHNKGNSIHMNSTSGGDVKIIDEDMQNQQESTSSGFNFSVTGTLSSISSASVGAHYEEHDHKVTTQEGRAKTTIIDKKNHVEQEKIEKQDYHHDFGIGFQYSHSFEDSTSPEINLPLKVYGQFGDMKFRIELPPLDMCERFQKGANIITNAVNYNFDRDAPNKIFKFENKQDEKKAETDLRKMLKEGTSYEESLLRVQQKYQVYTYEQAEKRNREEGNMEKETKVLIKLINNAIEELENTPEKDEKEKEGPKEISGDDLDEKEKPNLPEILTKLFKDIGIGVISENQELIKDISKKVGGSVFTAIMRKMPTSLKSSILGIIMRTKSVFGDLDISSADFENFLPEKTLMKTINNSKETVILNEKSKASTTSSTSKKDFPKSAFMNALKGVAATVLEYSNTENRKRTVEEDVIRAFLSQSVNLGLEIGELCVHSYLKDEPVFNTLKEKINSNSVFDNAKLGLLVDFNSTELTSETFPGIDNNSRNEKSTLSYHNK
ncbi:predicted protein [Naegleria gruberi]|uniref:Predicted protein n=1 Tax=Naegleria gruberi TaxID=5762 RepID=D2W4A9_NAEGR|nr:uncharacterized protein NAEGRDRAFT_82301 [Naegleria gruberi]EFC36097.1 predicted protein [Naegleria gruberi]|eukprot:XP_002668841.1 predicted protein [Naegleria gruberi strain NEG-M]